ncbi:MAG TPA: nucleotide disphospho-sugar-binding domain-containing protein [Methylibium sp.]|nr:nucleotide disphospho-sugar-binding domain-containing protein [Methylibium sp.]
MRILIACVGSAGDVHPFIAIGQALARRGHEVELQASPHFRARVEAAGLTLLPLGTEADYQRVVRCADLWNPRRSFPLMWGELQQRLVEAHDALVARVRPGDTVLVGSTLAWQTRLAQETQGLPAATVHLSPLCIFSAEAPARLPGWPDLGGWPVWLVRALHGAAERGVIDRTVAPGLDAIRRRLGLAPVRRVLGRWVHAPQRVVCAWPDWFAPPQRDWPAQAVTTGFVRWPAPAGTALPPALVRFLDAGPAPLGFTPGSAMAHGRDFFARAVAASAELGQRAVLVTPYADQLPAALPASVHVVDYAPFELLLPRLRALVHHGGIGTAAQAAAAGLPQGFVPWAHDQFDNAARWSGRGVGWRLPRHGWARSLERLLGDPAVAVAAARHAALLAPNDAQERIADLIEGLRP